jgi:molybdate transport system substrate-binding protein
MSNYKSSWRQCLGVFILSAVTLLSHAEEVTVAVAANFSAPFKEIISQFEKNTTHTVKASYGASGGFYTQISNGAPFQVFLSADSDRPEKLIADQAAVKGSDFVYAKGKLALWSAQANAVDGAGKVLTSTQVNHIAIANPATAPYGAAAIESLKKLGLYDQLKGKLVTADNIGQAYQFAVSGNAELGFVALSQIYSNGKISSGSAWIVPSQYYSPINQKAVLLNLGAESKAAKDFLQFLKSKAAKDIIYKYGYEL